MAKLVGPALAIFLRDPQDLFDRRDARPRLGPAIVAQRHHAVLDGMASDLARGPLGQNEPTRFLGDHEELVDSQASPVARSAAIVTALAARELDAARIRDPDGQKIARIR